MQPDVNKVLTRIEQPDPQSGALTKLRYTPFRTHIRKSLSYVKLWNRAGKLISANTENGAPDSFAVRTPGAHRGIR